MIIQIIILLNQNYQNLDLGFNCEVLSTSDFSNTTRLQHTASYKNNTTYVELNMLNTAQVDMRFYDIMGREIGSLTNEILFAGKHQIDVKATIKQRLSYGQYIYRIATGGQFYSKSILIK